LFTVVYILTHPWYIRDNQVALLPPRGKIEIHILIVIVAFGKLHSKGGNTKNASLDSSFSILFISC